jgi:hypothetical protein
VVLISGSIDQAIKDRESIKKGRRIDLLNNEKNIIFRDYFNKEQDAVIAKKLWNYFEAINECWPESWSNVKAVGNILPRTNGFMALIRFMPIVYQYLTVNGFTSSAEDFYAVFKNLNLQDGSFTTDIYQPGSSGQKKLFDTLINNFNLSINK